jgi:hypothetical protein
MDPPTIHPNSSNSDGIPTHQLEGTPIAQFEENDDGSVGDSHWQLTSPPTIPGIFFAILVDALPNLSPL